MYPSDKTLYKKKKKRKNTKIIEVVGGQWVVIRSTYRIGRGLSAAAADDFCDCPKMAYLGTGCGKKKLGLATASQHRLLKQSPWGEKTLFSKSSLH